MLEALNLTRAVLQLPLATPGSERAASSAAIVRTSSETDWTECVIRLDEHRISALAFHALRRHELLVALPEAQRGFLEHRYRHSFAFNQMSLLTLRGAGERLIKRGVSPIVCKGALLATSYYPDVGARLMADVDLWISENQRSTTNEVLSSMGFARDDTRSDDESEAFHNAFGIAFDVHLVMRLFEGRNVATRPLPELGPEGAFRGFVPDGLVAHLVAHMAGHAREMGPLLGWLLDLGFVLRRHAHELSAERLRELLGSDGDWSTLLRTLRFLEQTFGEPVPPALTAAASRARPLELEEILRQRRLASWNLSSPRGWARLAACGVGIRKPEGRHYPSLRDVLLWPLDEAVSLLERSRVDTDGRL